MGDIYVGNASQAWQKVPSALESIYGTPLRIETNRLYSGDELGNIKDPGQFIIHGNKYTQALQNNITLYCDFAPKDNVGQQSFNATLVVTLEVAQVPASDAPTNLFMKTQIAVPTVSSPQINKYFYLDPYLALNAWNDAFTDQRNFYTPLLTYPDGNRYTYPSNATYANTPYWRKLCEIAKYIYLNDKLPPNTYGMFAQSPAVAPTPAPAPTVPTPAPAPAVPTPAPAPSPGLTTAFPASTPITPQIQVVGAGGSDSLLGDTATQISNLTQKLKSCEEHDADIGNQLATNTKLLTVCQNDLASKLKDINNQKDQIDNLQKQLNLLTPANSQMAQQITDYKVALATKDNELSQVKQSLVATSSDKALQTNYNNLNTQYADLKKLYDQLKAQYDALLLQPPSMTKDAQVTDLTAKLNACQKELMTTAQAKNDCLGKYSGKDTLGHAMGAPIPQSDWDMYNIFGSAAVIISGLAVVATAK